MSYSYQDRKYPLSSDMIKISKSNPDAIVNYLSIYHNIISKYLSIIDNSIKDKKAKEYLKTLPGKISIEDKFVDFIPDNSMIDCIYDLMEEKGYCYYIEDSHFCTKHAFIQNESEIEEWYNEYGEELIIKESENAINIIINQCPDTIIDYNSKIEDFDSIRFSFYPEECDASMRKEIADKLLLLHHITHFDCDGWKWWRIEFSNSYYHELLNRNYSYISSELLYFHAYLNMNKFIKELSKFAYFEDASMTNCMANKILNEAYKELLYMLKGLPKMPK